MNFSNLPFKLFTLSIFIALIVPVLIQDGMFMDGMLYTCVAHNLAQGIGTFWNPIFSETYFTSQRPSFHEHPPLVFGIQAIFFKLLGSSMYVERFYSFLTACLTALLIMRIWKLIQPSRSELQSFGWLPVLFWIIIPVSFWAFQNNMQENTMSIFILLSVFFSLKVLLQKKAPIPNLILSGAFIFLATLSKGVPGLFPLGVYFLFYITHRNKITFNKMLVYSTIALTVPVVIYGLIMLWPEANESLSFYMRERLIGRVDTTPTVDNRFATLFKLFMELLPVIILMLLLFGLFAIKRIPIKFKENGGNMAMFMILLGFSGSLPLMITMVQKAFYFTPSLPFFALGFAILLAPSLNIFLKPFAAKKSFYQPALWISIALLTASIFISAMQIGKTSRNQNLLHDVYEIGEIVPRNSIINIDLSMWNEWDLQCYLIRYFYISIDPRQQGRNFVLLNENLKQENIEGYNQKNIELKTYLLFKKKD